MNDSIAISIQDVTKTYRLYDSAQQRLKEALHPFRKKYHHDFQALRNVSFEVPKGQTFGILGRNGSGKSTLLQIICGILQPTSGSITTNGRISALLELGAGFNPEFTGRSNVYMNGALMGFSRDEMNAQMESIEDFADIGEFIDQPAKTYSSGMYVRLAFACAINVKPDLLIVDEALSVGDVFFQQKCYAKIREIIASGTTCLFVSHDTQAIMNICDHAILLRNGEIDFQGAPEEAVSRYYASTGSRAPAANTTAVDVNDPPQSASSISPASIREHSILTAKDKHHGRGGMVVAAARVTDKTGMDTLEVPMMGELHFHLLLQAVEAIPVPSTGINIFDRLGNLVFAAGNLQLRQGLPPLGPGDELVVTLSVMMSVQAGEYTFGLDASEPSAEGPNVGYFHDRVESLGPILVYSPSDNDEVHPFYGIAQLPMTIQHSKFLSVCSIKSEGSNS